MLAKLHLPGEAGVDVSFAEDSFSQDLSFRSELLISPLKTV